MNVILLEKIFPHRELLDAFVKLISDKTADGAVCLLIKDDKLVGAIIPPSMAEEEVRAKFRENI